MQSVRRALISVSDKSGIVEFVDGLIEFGVQILSTGGTAKVLTANGIRVTEVSHYTGFPEIMDGRVKTLHPKIHAGLLGRGEQDAALMAEHDIEPIDLLVVNLYPFEQTIADPACNLSRAIENIDIGGPAMLRAAAKNHSVVGVVVDAGDYARVLEEMLANDGAIGDELRFDLATKVFEHTARYDGAIANYLGSYSSPAISTPQRAPFPRTLSLQFARVQDMRYGENPHQGAAFYRERAIAQACVASATLVQGKAMSYNNVADADAALESVKTFSEGPACVIVKHANPCGVAMADTVAGAYEHAYRTDPTSAYGGIIAFNRTLHGALASEILARQFVEVIIAPELDDAALRVLASKPNVRVLVTGELAAQQTPQTDFKRVTGGLLVQQQDAGQVSVGELEDGE